MVPVERDVTTKGRAISTGDKGINIAKLRRELALEPDIQLLRGSVSYCLRANCLTAGGLPHAVRFARFQRFGPSLALA